MRPKSSPRAAGLLVTLLIAGCSADQQSVVVLSARAPGDKCEFSDDSVYVSSGSVDMRPYDIGAGPPFPQTTTFYQVFSWENNMALVPLVVNGQVLDPGTGNNFIADQVVYNYQYSGPGQTFETEFANTRAVISAGGKPTDNSVGIDLIQPKAAQKLLAIVDATPQTLLVTFQIKGKVAAGNSLSTNEVTFPLRVYKSSTTELTCPPGQVLATNCGSVGRDSLVHCITPGP